MDKRQKKILIAICIAIVIIVDIFFIIVFALPIRIVLRHYIKPLYKIKKK